MKALLGLVDVYRVMQYIPNSRKYYGFYTVYASRRHVGTRTLEADRDDYRGNIQAAHPLPKQGVHTQQRTKGSYVWNPDICSLRTSYVANLSSGTQNAQAGGMLHSHLVHCTVEN